MWARLTAMAGLAVALSPGAPAQSLDERLDEEEFLRGLLELDVPEILDHHLETHRAADQDQVAQLRIASELHRMRAAAPNSEERERSLEAVLELRAEHIRLHPNHPKRALWLTDQASDLLLEMLPIDASGIATLFGVPSPAQRERARQVAGRMNGLMIQAEVEIERAVVDIESRPGYRDDETLRRQRRRLVQDERNRRIPFLRGVAACLYAEIVATSADDRREHDAIAVQLLAPLTDALTGTPARLAAFYAGLAQVRRAEYEDAEASFARILADRDATPTEAFAARAGLVSLLVAREGPAAGLTALDAMVPQYGGRESLFFRVLIADQRYLIQREVQRAASKPAKADPVNVYLELLESERDLPRATVRAIVLDKIADAVASTRNLRELPAIATIARADRLSREERRGPEAIMLFEQALSRKDLVPDDRATTLFGLGRVLHAMHRPGAAARRFLQVAVEHAGDARAPRAADLAVSILHQLHVRHPADEPIRLALDRALTTVFDAYPTLPDIGRWHYVAGELALERNDRKSALAHFGRIAPNAGEYPDAVFMQVNIQRAALEAQEAEPDGSGPSLAEQTALAEAARRASRIIGQRVPKADADRREDFQYYVAHLRVFRARALLATGDPSAALEVLRGIEHEPGADGTALAAALLVRIDAYQRTGRADEAQDEVLRFMATAPDQAGTVLSSMIALTLHDVETLFEQGLADEAREKAREDGLPLASLLEEWLAAHRETPDELRDRSLTQIATVYRFAERFEAGLAILDRLVADHPDTVEILFGRAECLFGLGGDRLADAMVIYKRLVAGGPGIGHTCYWQSQLRMLLVLDRVQKNTDKIVPRINRLRMGDEDLGGTWFRRQFEKLARKHS